MSVNSNLVFGPKLRAHRERRGITLAALAQSLKVKQSLLEDLERNDVSRWPPGIYGRAVVREYAKSIGLPAGETLEEFCGLFAEPPGGHGVASPRRDRAPDPLQGELRLTLAANSTATPRVMQRRLVTAAVELAIVLTTGGLVALSAGLAFSTSIAIVALSWYPCRTVLGGSVRWARLLRLPRFGRSPRARTPEITVATTAMSFGSAVIPRPAASPVPGADVGEHIEPSAGYASIH